MEQLKHKKAWRKIEWAPEMIKAVESRFPSSYNKELAKELGISWRSLVRKARELGIEKEAGFLAKRRGEISKMATEAKPPHPAKGKKGWHVPNSEATRFAPGRISVMKTDREVVERARATRNETIKKEKLRVKYGLSQKTNLKLINIY